MNEPRTSRRALLAGALASGAAGAMGAAFGYRFRADLSALRWTASAPQLTPPAGLGDFGREAERIREQHRQQSAATVAALKAKYEQPVFGTVRVWELVERLALCIDPSDTRLYCASQLVHVQQILASMEANGIDDPDLHVIAILHDLGKVLLLTDELPENVVCGTRRIGEYEHGCGLDQMVYQFGHGELIYSRVHGYVPDHVAWTLRYHNVSAADAAPYMNARDRSHAEKYLRVFQAFDGCFGSSYFRPRIDMAKYRALIEERFPQPILV